METDSTQNPVPSPRYQVALFVTCLADLFRPSVAFDCLSLLERAGCAVTVPTAQTCCGQPAYNTGDYEATIPSAKRFISTFEFADYVVAPSASCAAMICHHYPDLFEGEWRQRAIDLSAKTFELTVFLSEVARIAPQFAHPSNRPTVSYHDGCAGLRELGIKEQPRRLLKELCGIEVTELQHADECCGFGGTFCAKMPELSSNMVSNKLDDAIATGANILVGGDLGCLMNIAGRARRQGREIEVRHIAELLADNMTVPAIGEAGS